MNGLTVTAGDADITQKNITKQIIGATQSLPLQVPKEIANHVELGDVVEFGNGVEGTVTHKETRMVKDQELCTSIATSIDLQTLGLPEEIADYAMRTQGVETMTHYLYDFLQYCGTRSTILYIDGNGSSAIIASKHDTAGGSPLPMTYTVWGASYLANGNRSCHSMAYVRKAGKDMVDQSIRFCTVQPNGDVDYS